MISAVVSSLLSNDSLLFSQLTVSYHVVQKPIYTVGHKKCATLLLSISSPIIYRFSKFFHWHTLQTVCDNVIIIDPTTW